MTPLERLIQRATRLPEELVQLIIAEARRSMAQLRLRQSEAARTIQAAPLRRAYVRARNATGPAGFYFTWSQHLPCRYQNRFITTPEIAEWVRTFPNPIGV
jgi:hypothetical protein